MAKVQITVNEDAFIDMAWSLDMEPRPHYSGRGMFGKTCVALVGSVAGLFEFARLAERLTDNDFEPWCGPEMDTMGQQFVFYWPNITV